MIELCNESEIEEAEAKEFNLRDKEEDKKILVLRWQGELKAYINSCPHAGWPLNFQPDTFFNVEKTLIQCSNHMALFDPATGECSSGPCTGDKLTPVQLKTDDEKVYVELPRRDEFAADTI